jgi:hypothetical protein
MAINVAAVSAQFGSYYIKNPDNMKRLRNMLYNKVETAQFFQNRPTQDTKYRSSFASLDRVVQPFQKAFTPIGTLTFKPNEFDLFKLKIDKEETPDDLEATYEGFLAELEDLERANWPFIRWFMENHIMPAKQRDLELNEYFLGVYAAPVATVAGNAGTAMNGLRKVLRDYVTGGRTNLGQGAIAMGVPAADPADFVTQIEEWVDAIDDLLIDQLDYIFMNRTLAKRYIRGRKKKYNMNYAQVSDYAAIEEHPGIKVQGLKSHTGSDLIWTSPSLNRIRPTKKAALADTMKVESYKRSVALFTDWWEALNFEVPEFIITNDQDLA